MKSLKMTDALIGCVKMIGVTSADAVPVRDRPFFGHIRYL
jgi:hypothetical protein